ncbi:MAG: response regulator [Patescibacteria group bacterium]
MPKTILMIEDDQDQLKMYGFAFEKAGYRFLKAPNKIEGFNLAKKEKPDLILLDLLINGFNARRGGIAVLVKLKEDKETADIPIVIFTNYTKDEVIRDSRALGASEVIVKVDITPKELVKKMAEKYLQ